MVKSENKILGVRGIPTPGKNFAKFGGNTSCVELHLTTSYNF